MRQPIRRERPWPRVHLSGDAEKQLKYLGKTIDFVREQGALIILVVHPLPNHYKRNMDDAAFERITRIEKLAKEKGVEYIDFNYRMQLDNGYHFRDRHHLNREGVKEFNKRLMKELSVRGYLK